jgi:hypothetical protein
VPHGRRIGRATEPNRGDAIRRLDGPRWRARRRDKKPEAGDVVVRRGGYGGFLGQLMRRSRQPGERGEVTPSRRVPWAVLDQVSRSAAMAPLLLHRGQGPGYEQDRADYQDAVRPAGGRRGADRRRTSPTIRPSAGGAASPLHRDAQVGAGNFAGDRRGYGGHQTRTVGVASTRHR